MDHGPKSSPLPSFYGLQTKNGFHTISMVENIIKRIIPCDVLKLNTIQISMSISKVYWNTANMHLIIYCL